MVSRYLEPVCEDIVAKATEEGLAHVTFTTRLRLVIFTTIQNGNVFYIIL